jgi:hypothetical protein
MEIKEVTNMNFTYRNERFTTKHLIEATGIVANLGWTHVAAVTRPNGRKEYYANLVISGDTVLHAVVVK